MLLNAGDTDPIAATATLSGLDVLVNNAGSCLDTEAPIIQVEVELFRRTYEPKGLPPGQSPLNPIRGSMR